MISGDLPLLVARYNAGDPVPPVQGHDIRAALRLFSEVKDILRSDDAASPGAAAFGFLLEDLAARCCPGADVFAFAIRGVLVDVLLGQSPDLQPARREALIDAAAIVSLRASELHDPDSVRRRLDQLTA